MTDRPELIEGSTTAVVAPGRVPGRWISVAAASALAILALAFAPPEAQEPAIRLAIVVIGIVAAWRLLGRSATVTASSRERFEEGLAQPPATSSEIANLRVVDTDLRMAAASAFGLEFKLKPALRELAGWQLARNHGIDLDVAPDAARRVLGEPLWNLIRPQDGPLEFRAPGASLDEVQAGIDRLERL